MSYRNLAELHRLQAERLGPRTALRYRQHGQYRDVAWNDYRRLVEAVAGALLALEVQPGDRVAILSENRLEWFIADLAVLAVGGVTVPLHAPLTAKQIQFQLVDSGASVLFVSTAAQYAKLSSIRDEIPELLWVISFDRLGNADVDSWESLLYPGPDSRWSTSLVIRRRESSLGPDTLATIMYTSGTTGNPKGVMLTHGNLLSNAVGALAASPEPPDAVHLNWLPLSHIYARLVDHYQPLVAGCVVALAQSADTLLDDLREVEPTYFASVPRFYEKVLLGLAKYEPTDRVRRLRDVFGRRLDWMSSGGAPLPPAIAAAYHAAGLKLLQGYGLTESSPIITFNRRDDFKITSVGKALPGVEVAIAPDGEVMTRGPHVMAGYWNTPAVTAEALREGWLYTGDLGRLDADGFLTITGRKKDLLVLSNGKKVVPAFIEGLLAADECIEQVVVAGEGKNFLTALVVPHWDNLRRRLATVGVNVAARSNQELTIDPAVYTSLKSRIDAALADVAEWERVKKFVILAEPFSLDREEVTVSFKLRRGVVLERYAGALAGLYEVDVNSAKCPL